MSLARAVAAVVLLSITMPACSDTGDCQRWLDEDFDADGPGATAILVRDGEVVFRGAAGLNDSSTARLKPRAVPVSDGQ